MPAVTKVHVIFKTHLDVGFTDYAHQVVERYYTRYIPAALRLAKEMRLAGGPDRFIWTTGSWLIYSYLQQADPAARRDMEDAIRLGDIAWHGLPFTTHTELMDPSLFQFGLSLAYELDRRYGRQTIAAKMTDVPGHTIGMVPWMAQAGIQFLHIGVNPACRAPEVPDVFRWQHPCGNELVVMYHKGSYGSTMQVPGMREAIAFAHTGDNNGPQSAEQIHTAFAALRAQFPGAEVVASTLDNYAAALLAITDRLPVVTQEIGDTWIHGGATDPWKMAAYRSLCRTRARWLGEFRGYSPILYSPITEFSERLLLIPEHTWGLDEKTHLGDYTHYARPDFEAARQADVVPADAAPADMPAARYPSTERPPRYSTFEASWDEQRGYITQALEAVEGTRYERQAKAAVAAVWPTPLPREGYEPVKKPGEMRAVNNFFIRFDPATGALNGLSDIRNDRQWLDTKRTMGLFRYQTFSQADFDRYLSQYAINMEHTWVSDWAVPDFTKPGMAATGTESRWWLPTLTGLYEYRDANDQYFLATLTMPEEAVTRYGAPAEVEIEYFFPAATPSVLINLQWFGKAANRLPEAMWMTFQPRGTEKEGWLMDKMGTLVSPLDVVKYGNRRLHAINTGVGYSDDWGGMLIESLDAPLVAPGDPGLLDFDQAQPNLKHGMHFCLYNNIWGTNFPMWSEADGRFQFGIHLSPGLPPMEYTEQE